MKPHALVHSADTVRLAARMAEIEPFHVMEIVRRAQDLESAGRRIVHMEIGQPDFSAPQPVLDAAIAALRRDPMGYAASLGLPALRVAIARFYGDLERMEYLNPNSIRILTRSRSVCPM
jgi:aspartate/methionine/tyrosine aminotransferase